MTFLFGPNSAGKSAVLDALEMFQATFDFGEGIETYLPITDERSSFLYRGVRNWTRRTSPKPATRGIRISVSGTVCPQPLGRLVTETDEDRDALLEFEERYVVVEVSVTYGNPATSDQDYFTNDVNEISLRIDGELAFQLLDSGLRLWNVGLVGLITRPYVEYALSNGSPASYLIKDCTYDFHSGFYSGEAALDIGLTRLLSVLCSFNYKSSDAFANRVAAERTTISRKDCVDSLQGKANYPEATWMPVSSNKYVRKLAQSVARMRAQKVRGKNSQERTDIATEARPEKLISDAVLQKAFEDTFRQAVNLQRTELGYREHLLDFVNNSLLDLFSDVGYQVVYDLHEVRTRVLASSETRSVKARDTIGNICRIYLRDGSGRSLEFEDVGTGVSCVIPVLIDLHDPVAFFQQPELHLHPAMQSRLADIFVERIQHGKPRYLLESHSEYMLIRVLRRIRETFQGKLKSENLAVRPDQIAVLYFEPQSDGGTKVTEIPINEYGDFLKPWPQGFFEERARDLFDE